MDTTPNLAVTNRHGRRAIVLPLIAIALHVILLLSGCVSVPTAQLQAYSKAYDEAKSAAILIYADAAPALVAGGLKRAQFSASLGPDVFDRDGCGAVVASIAELRVRCQAMVALTGYNQALLDIAAGKSSDDILTQVDQAFNSVSSLAVIVPGSSAAAALGNATTIFPALQGILGEALKLRDRAALRDALMQGSPYVRSLIQSLRDDVDHLYEVQRTSTVARLDGIKNEIDRSLSPAFRMVALHSPPVDPAVSSSLGLLAQRFDDVFTAPEPSPGARLKLIKPSNVAGSRPLDASAVTSIDGQLRAATASVADFKTAVTQFNKSSEALGRYDRLLAAVDRSLTELLMASSRPFSPGGGTDELLKNIVTIRDDARDIKQLLSAR